MKTLGQSLDNSTSVNHTKEMPPAVKEVQMCPKKYLYIDRE